VSSNPRFAILLRATGIAAAVAFATIPAMEAAAQGFFDFLFGGGARQQQATAPQPQQTTAYADPSGAGTGNPGPAQANINTATGRATTYCVRLCDGRYFPIQRHTNATPVQLCSALCPASQTKVFNGSSIDAAWSSSGGRYENLDNAYVYRDKIVADCTCNGKDPFGLAKIDVDQDPTVRAGDMIATAGGLVKASGSHTATARAAASASDGEVTGSAIDRRRHHRRRIGVTLRDW